MCACIKYVLLCMCEYVTKEFIASSNTNKCLEPFSVSRINPVSAGTEIVGLYNGYSLVKSWDLSEIIKGL